MHCVVSGELGARMEHLQHSYTLCSLNKRVFLIVWGTALSWGLFHVLGRNGLHLLNLRFFAGVFVLHLMP